MTLPLILRHIADVIGAWNRSVEPGSLLCDDLAMDSLHMQTLAADLDVAFGIEIPDDDLATWITPQDVLWSVVRLQQEREILCRMK